MRTQRAAPDVEFDFEHDLSAPRLARQSLAPLFRDPQDPIAIDVELAASELVTNVIVHTADGGTLKAWDRNVDRPLRLEVEDFDGRVPRATGLPPASAASGHGLAIVECVSDSWGVDTTSTGKIVWAEFARPDGDPARPARR